MESPSAATDKHLVVCVNERLGMGQPSCAASGSRQLVQQLRELIDRNGLDFAVTEQVCLGRCEEGIAVRIAPGGPFFTRVREADLPAIVEVLIEFKPSA